MFMDKNIFCNRLKQKRKENKLSQDQLAERLGISRYTVIDWEKGKKCPDIDTLSRICEILKTSISYIVGEIDTLDTQKSQFNDTYIIRTTKTPSRKIMLNAMELKDAIKEIREMSQYTIEQMAEKMGVSHQTVAAWESGAAIPSKEQLRQMNLLSGELETLLDRGEDPGIGELSLLGGFIPEKALSPERIQQREMLRRMMFAPLSKHNILQNTTGQAIAQAAGRANRENGAEELSSAAAKLRESVKFGYAALSPQDRLMVKTALQAALADISDIELREKNATITEQSAKTA